MIETKSCSIAPIRKLEQRMKDEVDKVLKTGDSFGGVFEVVAHNVPPGSGHVCPVGRTPRWVTGRRRHVAASGKSG